MINYFKRYSTLGDDRFFCVTLYYLNAVEVKYQVKRAVKLKIIEIQCELKQVWFCFSSSRFFYNISNCASETDQAYQVISNIEKRYATRTPG